MRVTTPLRSFVTVDAPDGSSVVDHPVARRILGVLETTEDLSSWSDELATHVDDWDERLHLSPQRANVLRGLPLEGVQTVLEIGAAAGSLTRYLGETFPLVDALETDPAFAAVARRRCADLPHVAVHEVALSDVPVEAAYDLIVAVDVPTSTGSARDDLTALLASCRALLRPGGRIVAAVDNVQGPRHLAGGEPPVTPGHPAPLLASRADLEDAAASAGLGAQVLGAFPDHRHTVTLIEHAALRAVDASLLERIVRLPSPNHRQEPIDEAVEVRSWSEAVAAGTDAQHGNSLVMVAGEVPLELDPVTYWSSGRRAELSACNRVRESPDGPVVVRDHAYPSAPALGGPLVLRPHTEPYVPGTSLVDVLAATPTADAAQAHLRTWIELIAEAERNGGVPWDLIPRNVQIDDAGMAHAIDQEWEHRASDHTSTVLRGAFWLAYDLLFTTVTPGWLSGHTVSSAADVLVALAGHDVPADWRDVFSAEAESMASVAPRPAHESFASRTRKERRNLSYLSHQPRPEDDGATRTVIQALSASNHELRARIEDLETARRHDEIVARDHAIGLRAKIETALAELARVQEQAVRQRRRADRLQAEIASVRSSTTWRLGRTLVAPAARLTGRRRA